MTNSKRLSDCECVSISIGFQREETNKVCRSCRFEDDRVYTYVIEFFGNSFWNSLFHEHLCKHPLFSGSCFSQQFKAVESSFIINSSIYCQMIESECDVICDKLNVWRFNHLSSNVSLKLFRSKSLQQYNSSQQSRSLPFIGIAINIYRAFSTFSHGSIILWNKSLDPGYARLFPATEQCTNRHVRSWK